MQLSLPRRVKLRVPSVLYMASLVLGKGSTFPGLSPYATWFLGRSEMGASEVASYKRDRRWRNSDGVVIMTPTMPPVTHDISNHLVRAPES